MGVDPHVARRRAAPRWKGKQRRGVLILRRHLVIKLTTTTAALAAVLGAGLGSADPARASDRVHVCAKQLHVTLEPNQHWQGTLHHGESFAVRKHSDSGKYAYGLAYGHINRLGWVRADGLCGSAGAASAKLAGQRVPVAADRLVLHAEPNQSPLATLEHGETFKVRKLSDSGKYAYGFAYGDVNETGWVLAGGLRGGGSTGGG
jgi:hypothetical protein